MCYHSRSIIVLDMTKQAQFLSFDNNCAKIINDKILISCPLMHACLTIIIITLLISDKRIFAHIAKQIDKNFSIM